MGHQIRMPPEAGKWIAGVLGKIGFRVALPGLDAAYQQQLVALSRVRRAAADVATSRKRLELQIGDLERQADEQGNPGSKDSDGDAEDQSHTARDVTGQLADLRRQCAEMQAKEERITDAQPAADGGSQCLPKWQGSHQGGLHRGGRGSRGSMGRGEPKP